MHLTFALISTVIILGVVEISGEIASIGGKTTNSIQNSSSGVKTKANVTDKLVANVSSVRLTATVQKIVVLKEVNTTKTTTTTLYPTNMSDALKEWIKRQESILEIFKIMQKCTNSASNVNATLNLTLVKNSTILQRYIDSGFQNPEDLFNIFWYNWENPQLLKNISQYLANGKISKQEFYVGFAPVVLNKGYKIIPSLDMFPRTVLGTENTQLGIEEKFREKVGMNYYVEDPGLRSFYTSWFLYNPLWWDEEKHGSKERMGELFLYFVHQLHARYNAERLAGNLKELPLFRFKGAGDDEFLKNVEDQIKEYAFGSAIRFAEIGDPVNEVGELFLTRVENGKYYLNELIAQVMKSRKLINSQSNWFRVIQFIESANLGMRQRKLAPYYKQDLNFKGVAVASIKISRRLNSTKTNRKNVIYTKFIDKNYFIRKCNKTLKITKRLLDHEEFSYDIQISSSLENKTNATVGIFLCPKYDFDGEEIQPFDYIEYTFQMDFFQVSLTKGKNKFRRLSKRSSLFSRGSRPYLRQLREIAEAKKDQGAADALEKARSHIHCGIPLNLLVPQGRRGEGVKYKLFIIVMESGDGGTPYSSICTGGKSPYPFGFPFNRHFEPGHLLDEIYNAKTIEIRVVGLSK